MSNVEEFITNHKGIRLFYKLNQSRLVDNLGNGYVCIENAYYCVARVSYVDSEGLKLVKEFVVRDFVPLHGNITMDNMLEEILRVIVPLSKREEEALRVLRSFYFGVDNHLEVQRKLESI